MNHPPGTIHIAKQEGLESGLVELKPARVNFAFYFSVGNRPGKITFEMNLDIFKIQRQEFQGVFFRFDMVCNEIIQAFVLATGFDISCPLKIKKVLPERRPVTVFPAVFHGGNNV